MAASDKLCELVKGKKVSVLGIGVSNTPLVEMLCDFGATVTVHDIKSEEKLGDIAKTLKEKGVSLCLGKDYLDNIEGDVIFKSPGIRYDAGSIQKAVQRGAYLTSEMQMFFELCPARIVAVTGSDGKTTTTTLVSKILESAGARVFLGGNIGRPLLPIVDEMTKDDYAVVELSSFQLHQMTRSPDIAIVTNLTPNHLDWHTGMDEYTDAKANILRYQNENSRAVLNFEDDVTRSFADIAKGDVVFFSSKRELPNGVCIKNGSVYCCQREVMALSDIKLPGKHNVENYMAAIGALAPYVDFEDVRRVARTFGGVEHRCEFVRELDNVRYYNSSIDSSPTRTIAALGAFDQKLIVLCGGYDKNLDYTPLAKPLCERAKAVIITGATKDKIKNALLDCPEYKEGAPLIIESADYEESVKLARQLSREGDIVLLSPASASFDCFANFMERGNLYKKWVNELE